MKMKRFKEFSKKVSEFYQWILKYSLWLLVIISFCDIYFYLQIFDQRFTNLFVEFRLLFAVFIIFHGILAIFKPLWNYYALKRALIKKECGIISLDIESFCPPKIERKPNFFKNIYKGTEEDDLIIKDYIFHLKSVNEDIQKCYLSQIIKYFVKPKTPIDNMIENGILPILVELLQAKSILIKIHATILIRLILEKSHLYYVKNIVEADAIPALIEVLKNEDVQEDALVALLFIVGKKSYDELCLKSGIIEAFMTCFDSENISDDFASNIISMVIGLCTISSNDSISSQNAKTLLPLLKKLPFEENPKIISNILNLINGFKDNGPKYIQILMDNNIFNLVIDNLEAANETIQKRAFIIFSDLLTVADDVDADDEADNDDESIDPSSDGETESMLNNGNDKKPNSDDIDKYQQNLIDSEILPIAYDIYNNTVDSKLEELILTFIGCLANGDETKIQAIIDADYIPTLLDVLDIGTYRDNLLPTTFKTLLNFIKSSNPEQAILLIDTYDFISICCSYLNHENLEYCKMALSCINQLLKKTFDHEQRKEVCKNFVDSGGFSEVERLQMHPRLAQIVNDIIKDYMNLKNDVSVTVDNIDNFLDID